MHQVYGTVNPDGHKSSGSDGWESRVAGGGDGLFLIQFEPSFSKTPTVVTTQIFPNKLPSAGGDTRDNALVVGADHNEVKIKTGNSDGAGENRWFSFIAIGE